MVHVVVFIPFRQLFPRPQGFQEQCFKNCNDYPGWSSGRSGTSNHHCHVLQVRWVTFRTAGVGRGRT